MTIERRKQLLVVGLYALLLVASPGLSWNATYNCLISGAIGLDECCKEQRQVQEPDCCTETGPGPETLFGESSCDCCELVLTRQVPGSKNGPSGGQQLAWLPSPSAESLPRRPSRERTPAPEQPPSRTGPGLWLLYCSLLF